MSGEQKRVEFLQLYQLSVQHGWRCLPMLAKLDTKQPIYKHAAPHDYDAVAAKMAAEMDGTAEQQAHWDRKLERCSLNMLLEELYVIDSDSPEASEWLQQEVIPRFADDFATCPMQKTRKGFHYIFQRPPNCDHFNTARAVTLADGRKPEIDICTITSTGTRGNLNIWPSANKQWVRSIHECIPKAMSAELHAYLDSIFTGKRKSTTRVHPQASPVTAQSTQNTQNTQNTREVTVHASLPNTPRQELYTEFIIRRSLKGGRESVGRDQVIWTSEGSARVNTHGSPIGCRQCMANEGHVADGDNAVVSLLPDGQMLYKCFSPTCKGSAYFALADVVLYLQRERLASRQAQTGDTPNDTDIDIYEGMADVLKVAMPGDWSRLYSRMASALGQLRPRDLALEALELGDMSAGRLLRCADSHDVLAFDGHTFRHIYDEIGALYNRWIKPLEAIIKGIHGTLSALLKHFEESMKRLETQAKSKQITEGQKSQLKERIYELNTVMYASGFNKGKNTLWAAFASIGTKNAGGIPACMTHHVTEHDLAMDANPHLMGCKNGVLDLRAGVLRDGHPDDRITMNVGYAMEIREPSDRFLQDVVGRIFPVLAEREAVRSIFAYILYGKAPCKSMFIFTDVLGGFNGKSKILEVLLAAMGEYGHISDARMILDGSKSANASSHDEAGAALKNKRLNLMDEGLKKKKINIKDTTSAASYKKAHRRCGKPLTKADYFEDTAKHILACNQGDDPVLNQSDQAELKRLVYVQCRAIFVQDVERHRLEHPDHQHVFKADPELADVDFRVDMTNWLLPAYRELSARTGSGVVTLDLDADIPESFKTFKVDKIGEQAAPIELREEMRSYFNDNYEPCETCRQEEHIRKKQYVQSASFLRDFRYQDATEALLADATSLRDANKQLSACFEGLYPDNYKKKANGVNKCILGFKRKRNAEAFCEIDGTL